jgi:hypothetical protein
LRTGSPTTRRFAGHNPLGLLVSRCSFCVAAFANGMTEDRIGCALEDDYLCRDSQRFQASCLHPENHGEGEEMDWAMSIDVAILLYGSSFLRVGDGSLHSELAFATRVMRESRRTGRLPSGLPF